MYSQPAYPVAIHVCVCFYISLRTSSYSVLKQHPCRDYSVKSKDDNLLPQVFDPLWGMGYSTKSM